MTTIKLAAEALHIPSKKLLNELRKNFPEQAWTLDSVLPEGFEDAAKQHAAEYAEASGVELPKGKLVTSDSAVLDTKLILESLEYGFIEAISQLRSAELIESAQLTAVADIQTFESVYNEVWDAYYQKKLKDSQQHRNIQNQQKAKQLIDLNAKVAERQGELIGLQEQFRNSQENSRQQTQTVLDALLK